MELGRLDRVVTIEQVSYADDSYGDGQTPTWSTYKADVWMRKDYPTNGGEVFEAEQTVNVSNVIWTCQYLAAPAVNNTMRINDGTDKWYIIRQEEIGRQKGWKLTCENRDNE